MKMATIADFKNRMPSFLKVSRKEPVFLTRNGRIEAVIEAISEDEIEDYLLERSPRFRSLLDRVARKKGGMSLEQYRHSRKV